MAWPRNGLIILNNVGDVSPNSCTTAAPTSSCAVPGGNNVGNSLDNPIVAQTLFTNMNVLYHKINLELTKTNIYGEALEKWYYQPVNVRCTIERGEITNGDDDFGVTIANTIKINIPKALLQQYNFLPEVGDIIMDREKYYEINSIDTQFVTIPGTNAPNNVIGTTGQIMTYTLSGYLTRITKLNIIPYYQ
jgi:hypothetical protein